MAIAGATCSCRATYLWSLLTALHATASDDEVRLICCGTDTRFDGRPGTALMLAPHSTGPNAALTIIHWLQGEIDRRLGLEDKGCEEPHIVAVVSGLHHWPDRYADPFRTSALDVLKRGKEARMHLVLVSVLEDGKDLGGRIWAVADVQMKAAGPLFSNKMMVRIREQDGTAPWRLFTVPFSSYFESDFIAGWWHDYKAPQYDPILAALLRGCEAYGT